MSEAAVATNASASMAARTATTTSARPGVLSLAIKEKAALYAAYMPWVTGGGLFVPTTRPAQLGDDVYVILSLMDDPAKMSIQGKVVWITPTSTAGRQQGIGLQFNKAEASEQARAKIENLLGSGLKSSRATHTL
jgi:type IV pilus assembly protein PilZ